MYASQNVGAPAQAVLCGLLCLQGHPSGEGAAQPLHAYGGNTAWRAPGFPAGQGWACCWCLSLCWLQACEASVHNMLLLLQLSSPTQVAVQKAAGPAG